MAPTLTPGTPPAAALRGELRYGFELARRLAGVLDEEDDRWTG